MKKLLIVVISLIFLGVLFLPLFLKNDLLLFYGTVLGSYATLIAVVISIAHYNHLAHERRIPFLVTSLRIIDITDFLDREDDQVFKYISEDKTLETKDYKGLQEIKRNLAYYETQNQFCEIEIYNMNNDFGVFDLSLTIDGEEITKDIFIKTIDNFRFLLGFHVGIFNKTNDKRKKVSICYKYKSIDADINYTQKSFVELLLVNNYPKIKLLSPSISKRKKVN